MKNGDKIPTGPAMMMKALGIDPAMIMGNIESAKTTATQVMNHFEKRLNVIDAKLDEILANVRKVN